MTLLNRIFTNSASIWPKCSLEFVNLCSKFVFERWIEMTVYPEESWHILITAQPFCVCLLKLWRKQKWLPRATYKLQLALLMDLIYLFQTLLCLFLQPVWVGVGGKVWLVLPTFPHLGLQAIITLHSASAAWISK